MPWLVQLVRLTWPLIKFAHRRRRGLTLGVKGLVFDEEGRVLLIEQTYVAGWHLPGGGVERGETAHEALEREMLEEVGVRLTGPAQLVSIHNNDAIFAGDHVLVYRVTDWRPGEATSRGEVRQARWFRPEMIPPDATPATRLRIQEAVSGGRPGPYWSRV